MTDHPPEKPPVAPATEEDDALGRLIASLRNPSPGMVGKANGAVGGLNLVGVVVLGLQMFLNMPHQDDVTSLTRAVDKNRDSIVGISGVLDEKVANALRYHEERPHADAVTQAYVDTALSASRDITDAKLDAIYRQLSRIEAILDRK